MPRERKPNTARITYDREELLAVLHSARVAEPAASGLLNEYERRREEGKDLPCQSVAHHGPGHQSSTYCEATGGAKGHDRRGNELLHYAEHVGEWTDSDPYVDYWG